MDEVVYTARAATKELVREVIGKLSLSKNSLGQYGHNDIITLQKGISHVLGTQYNSGAPGQGIKQPLASGNNALTRVRASNVITVKFILDESLAKARAAAKPGNEAGPPIIASRPDAIDKDNRRNLKNQAVIGAKEGAAKAISNLVGSDVTDGILHSSD